jgi:hypothetical protein
LGTHFHTILGTGFSSDLVIFLVFTGGFSSFVLTDATISLIFFTSFFFGSFFFFFSPSFYLGSSLTTLLTQNVHPAPNTQQAEQSWLHTSKE